MATKVIPIEKWVLVTRVDIKITKTESSGFYCRVFSTIKFMGKLIEKDLFPYSQDFFVSNGGTLTLGATKSFKMKTKLEII